MELINYSSNQKKAIEHGAGPLMVLAGPGSGKTFVITHRIKYLIEGSGINPAHILVVRARPCSRKRTNKPPAMRVVEIALALCEKPPNLI